MSHSLYRRTALALWAPALALVLAACGGTAINSDYTPGPSNNAVGVAPGNPTSAATMHASKSAHPTTSAHPKATHSSATKTGALNPSNPGAPHKTAPPSPRKSGGGHVVTPTCPWQSGTPTIMVTPCTGLANGQTVTIQGKGFKANLRVLAVECLANASGPDSCNIDILSPPPTKLPNADGTVTFTLKVASKVAGTTCSASTPCVVSISSTDNGEHPSEDPSAPISFG